MDKQSTYRKGHFCQHVQKHLLAKGCIKFSQDLGVRTMNYIMKSDGFKEKSN
jgi:hypothetical protein